MIFWIKMNDMASFYKFMMLILASFFCYFSVNAQGVNGFARVTAISGTTLTVSNVDESGDSFVAGEQAIIMQMQDNVIGSTANDASFGDLGSIQSAGLYEVVTISNVNLGANTIEVNSINNSYNTGANSRVQIMTYPELGGGGDYTTTGDIFADAWNGNTGGVIAFQVGGTLTLRHNILADGRGFRGGAASTDNNSSDPCDPNNYINASNSFFSNKGESIYLNSNTNFTGGRGKILNGGGGGNRHNGGGGGGSNYSSGGEGGPGYAPGGQCTPATGGLGGIALSGEIGSGQVFMGGGGGAGEGNNGFNTSGARGGGIILISAVELFTNTCSSGAQVRISANGNNANSSIGNDAAGGAGAAGSIVLNVASFTVSGGCQLSVSADGGDGGDVDGSTATHGGGGGGGFGVVYYSSAQPTTNVNTSTNPGIGGDNDSDGSGGIASPGQGVIGAEGGVLDNTNSPLPVEFLSFNAVHDGDYNVVKWKTASETNNDYFEIQLSQDGTTFSSIGTVKGSGTKKDISFYQFKHLNQFFGTIYYRLKQVDFDGSYEYSKTIFLERKGLDQSFKINLFPNPTQNDQVNLQVFTHENEPIQVQIIDALGKKVNEFTVSAFQQSTVLDLRNLGLQKGIYVFYIKQGDQESINKLLVK